MVCMKKSTLLSTLLFENTLFEGTQSAARIWEEVLPWSGIQTVEPDKSLIRLYNPFEETAELSTSYSGVDPFGNTQETVQRLSQNAIVHLLYQPHFGETPPARSGVTVFEFPEWPIGESHSTVDVTILDELRKKIEGFKQEQTEARAWLADLSKEKDTLRYHQIKHAEIRLEREILELELSILLNELKRQKNTSEIREKIRLVGEQLNLSRRHRRTYDYILSLFENQ